MRKSLCLGSFVAVVTLALSIFGCKARQSDNGRLNEAAPGTSDAGAAPANGTDLAAGVSQIFESNCAGCHAGGADNFKILDFNALRSAPDRFVNVAQPDNSPLLQRLKEGSMPPDGSPRLKPEQIQVVQMWIAAGAPDAPKQSADPMQDPRARPVIDQVSASYRVVLKDLLDSHCGDCHSSGVAVPTQGYLPTVGDVVLDDIRRGQAKMDINGGFPFVGSHSVAKMIGDLQMLASTIKANTMPPTKYVVAHWSTSLTQDEKSLITQWCTMSANRLQVLLTPAAVPQN